MPLEKFLVFIIDDDSFMRNVLKEFIQSKYIHATINCYETGEKALMELHQKPDVILLDYHLDSKDNSALNGLEILKRIKQLLHAVPVIFISASDDPQISANIIKYGAFDYIVKGDSALPRLEVMINNATGHLSLRKEMATQKVFNRILLALFVVIFIIFLIYQFL
jgi:CheY-like chemotaxis protein